MILSKKDRIILAKAFNEKTFTDGDYSYTVETISYKDVGEVCDDAIINGIDYCVIEVLCKVRCKCKTTKSHFGLLIKKDYLSYILSNHVKVYIDSFVVYIADSGNVVLDSL